MNQARTVVVEIEQILRGTDLRQTHQMEVLAQTYTSMVNKLLNNLKEAERLLALNKIDELVELLYKNPPSLEERARILMFEKRKQWLEICEDYGLPTPEHISIERLSSLSELTQDKRLLPNMLSSWRIINRTGNTSQKLEILRKISVLSPSENSLEPIHAQIAKQHAESLKNEAKNAIEEKNYVFLKQLERSLKQADIMPYVQDAVFKKIDRILTEWRQAQHREKFNIALNKLSDAYALFDLDGVKKALDQIQDQQADKDYVQETNDIEQIKSARTWYDELRAEQDAEEKYQYALRLFEKHLDENNYAEAEKVRYEILQIMGNTIPNLSEVRFHQLGENMRYKTNVKFKATIFIVIASLILLSVGAVYAIHLLQIRNQEASWVASIHAQINAGNFTQANELLSQFKDKIPSIVDNNEYLMLVQKVKKNISQKMRLNEKFKEHLTQINQTLILPAMTNDDAYDQKVLDKCATASEELKSITSLAQELKNDFPEYEHDLKAIALKIASIRSQINKKQESLFLANLEELRNKYTKLGIKELVTEQDCIECQKELTLLNSEFQTMKHSKWIQNAKSVSISDNIRLAQEIVQNKIKSILPIFELQKDFKRVNSIVSYKQYIANEIKLNPSAQSKYVALTPELWKIYENIQLLSKVAITPTELTPETLSKLENLSGYKSIWQKALEDLMQKCTPIPKEKYDELYSIFDLLFKAFDSFPYEFTFTNDNGKKIYLYSEKNPEVIKTSSGTMIQCKIETQLSISKPFTLRLNYNNQEWLPQNTPFLDRSYKKVLLFDSAGRGITAEHSKFIRALKKAYDEAPENRRLAILRTAWQDLKNNKALNPWWYYHLGSFILRLTAYNNPKAFQEYNEVITQLEKQVPVEDREWFTPGPNDSMYKIYTDAINAVEYEKINKRALDGYNLLYRCLNRALVPSGILLRDDQENFKIHKFNVAPEPEEYWVVTPNAEKEYEFYVLADKSDSFKLKKDALSGRFEYEVLWSPSTNSTQEILKMPIVIESPAMWPKNVPWRKTQ